MSEKHETIWFTTKEYRSHLRSTLQELHDMLIEAGINPKQYQVQHTDTHVIVSNW